MSGKKWIPGVRICLGCALIVLWMPGADGVLWGQENGGVVLGTVKLPAQVHVAPRVQSSRYRSTSPPVPASGQNEKPEVTNVVIYVEGPGLDEVKKGDKVAVLDQRDATFVPHVLPIVKGTQVRIVNRDKTYHNVFSLSKVKKFNIGRRPTGEEVPVDFEKTGEVQVFCDIHSNMSATILVLDNPMFVRPNDDGSFEIRGLPPGQYTVHAWHERMSSPPKQVAIRSGETVTVDFDFQ